MKKNEGFLSVFISEFVEIVTDLNIVTHVNMTEEGNATPVDVPLTVSGFVMDADELFVYLSQDGEGINQAVPMDSIKHIAIVDVNAVVDEALDAAETPEDSGSYH